jgi:alpha-beta hydrolase superfamily lysophospholipase
VELICAEPTRALDHGPNTDDSEHLNGLPPVIFLHGAFHSAAAFEETFLPLFAREGVAAYALSITGAGLSPDLRRNAGQPARLNQWLADLDAAVDEVTQRSSGRAPIIVGHSIGGGVAQVYAADSFLCRKISGVGLLAGFPPNVVRVRLLESCGSPAEHNRCCKDFQATANQHKMIACQQHYIHYCS